MTALLQISTEAARKPRWPPLALEYLEGEIDEYPGLRRQQRAIVKTVRYRPGIGVPGGCKPHQFAALQIGKCVRQWLNADN
ncbi:hypothetical protein MRS75_19130 [Rhizobiaceae bacterium n36]|uniref:Uncharacterized protein n=1 Tax=Ferirhizobium litorale TaxID=2927786 RepID=A0AAE3QFP3_9HYPH|nr:hypothetical protein [Fererhizobium litorale]